MCIRMVTRGIVFAPAFSVAVACSTVFAQATDMTINLFPAQFQVEHLSYSASDKIIHFDIDAETGRASAHK